MDSFEILHLPELALERVLLFCDLRTLKSIRLVCHELKRAIESRDENLFKFPVTFYRMKRIGEVLKSKVNWNNFYFDLDDRKVSSKSTEKSLIDKLTKLALKYANTLKILESTDSDLLKPFVFKCNKSLEIIHSVLKLSNIKDKHQKFPQFDKLKDLHMKIDAGFGEDFLDILRKCPNLQKLTIGFTKQFQQEKDGIEKDFVGPLRSFLEERTNKTKLLKQKGITIKNLTIHFATSLSYSYWKFLIPFKDLLQIIQLCTSSNVRLENLPSSTLPLLNEVSEDNCQVLVDKCIRSTTAYSEPFKNVYVPKGCGQCAILQLDLYFFLRQITSFDSYDKLESLTVFIENTRAYMLNSSDSRSEALALCLNTLFHRPKPNLRELNIETILDMKLQWITKQWNSIMKLDFEMFPNLTKLHLDLWGEKDEDFWQLYKLLPLLQILELVKCYTLKDSSITGGDEDSNSILTLKYLKRLEIKGFWSIGDISFQNVFSKMKLSYLEVWDEPDSHKQRITMNAFECMGEGEIGNTIEILKVNRPFKSSLLDIKKTLRRCKSLKYYELREESFKDRINHSSAFSTHHF